MEKCYEIKFHPAALKEFCALDGSVKILVKKQLDKLKAQPFLGGRTWKQEWLQSFWLQKNVCLQEASQNCLFYS